MRTKTFYTSAVAFLLCCITIMLSSCKSTQTDNMSNGTNSETYSNSDKVNTVPITFLEGKSLELIKKSDIPAGKTKGSLGVMSAFDGRYLLVEHIDDMLRYYEHDPTNNNGLNYIGEMKSGFISSGDYIMTNNNEYWYSQAENESDELLLYKVDIEEKSVKVVSRDKITPPFQYYHKIDENNLVVFGPNELQDSNGEAYYSYNIDIYDISNNKKRNIIQIADPNKMKGIPAIYYANGLIYTLHTESHPGDTSHLSSAPYVIPGIYSSHFIRAYDTDGNLKLEFSLPDMTEFESINNYFTEIFIIDNIAFLSTLSRVIVAFEMLPDGTVSQLDLPLGRGILIFAQKGGLADKAYLLNKVGGYLIVFDRKDRSFIKHHINMDLEKYYAPFLGENGDLLFGLQEEEKEPIEIFEFQ